MCTNLRRWQFNTIWPERISKNIHLISGKPPPNTSLALTGQEIQKDFLSLPQSKDHYTVHQAIVPRTSKRNVPAASTGWSLGSPLQCTCRRFQSPVQASKVHSQVARLQCFCGPGHRPSKFLAGAEPQSFRRNPYSPFFLTK